MAESGATSGPEADWVELTQFDALELDQGLDPESAATSEASSRYAFMGRVGKGAMGEVLLAQDRHLRRKVAYKKILPQMASNRSVLSRFFTEAQITAQLDHPAIIPVYNLEVAADGQIAYSMKLVQGRTFKELMQEARTQISSTGKTDDAHSQASLLNHFLKVCDAMYFAHCKGVIHRDLKPANIMIGPYREVYVMDWGIARIMGGHEESLDEELVRLIQPDADAPPLERTQLGQILGTPRYLSPEQTTGKNDQLDGRSDMFALGLILFELVSLRPAISGANQVEMLKKILKAEKEPLVHLDPQIKIAPELAAIVHKATMRKRDERYADVQALADDLRRFVRGEEVLARPDTLWRRLGRWITRHRQAALLGLCVLVLLSLASVGGLLYRRQQAMLAARAHEQRLSAFLERVADRSRAIDRYFFLGEMALESLAAVVTEALVQGERSPARLYFAADFAHDPPPDYAYSERYRKAISTGWPVFKLAPGTDPAALRPRLEQLNRLRRDLGRLFVRGSLGASPVPGPAPLARLIGGKEQSLRWIYAGLNEGIMFAYPGKGGYPPAYDPRKRPWYQRALGSRGPHWQDPYLDIQGQGWLLPCTRTLYDYHQRFLGVAGVEIALSDILRSLDLPDTRARAAYLLNRRFEIVARKQAGQPALAAGAQPEPAPWPEAVAQLRARDSGYLELGQTLLVFYRLDALGWTYVIEAGRELLEPTDAE